MNPLVENDAKAPSGVGTIDSKPGAIGPKIQGGQTVLV